VSVERFVVRSRYAADGATAGVDLVDERWPAHIALTDELLDEHDERWIQVRGDWVWFLLSNAYAQYRKRVRDEWRLWTEYDLEDGDRW
jgi:hypothetical protein